MRDPSRDPFDTPFFKQHDRVDKMLDKPGRMFAGMAVLTVLLNLALLAGAIVVVVLVLRALGVIA